MVKEARRGAGVIQHDQIQHGEYNRSYGPPPSRPRHRATNLASWVRRSHAYSVRIHGMQASGRVYKPATDAGRRYPHHPVWWRPGVVVLLFVVGSY